jgi:cyclic pyranopterin phosphate synthase
MMIWRLDMGIYKKFEEFGCVIMASGVGKRFGGNKLMADFRGRPMICQILDSTEGIFGERIVVTRNEEVLKLCEDMNIKTIYHELPHRNDTIRLGLEALSDKVKYCMFCQSDQPLLSKKTIYNMLVSADEESDYIWQIKSGDRVGAPVIFPRWAFDELKNLPEGKGGILVIKSHPDNVKYVETDNKFELMDVDTKEDLVKFTHFNKNGDAIIVDVHEKADTYRVAKAEGFIKVNQAVFDAINEGNVKKGDVLGVARIAGIMGAKKNSDLIPLCHNLPLSNCTIDFEMLPETLQIRTVCTTSCIGKTGVEMEALTGVSITLLTIYDMCKAIDKAMEISEIHLLEKEGGKSGHYVRKV